jgi:hypothetical protein
MSVQVGFFAAFRSDARVPISTTIPRTLFTPIYKNSDIARFSTHNSLVKSRPIVVKIDGVLSFFVPELFAVLCVDAAVVPYNTTNGIGAHATVLCAVL